MYLCIGFKIEHHGPGRFPVKNKEMNFEYFKIVCEELAKSIGCTFKFYDCTEFGWFGGYFDVDAFGGTAAFVKYHNGVWSNNDFAFGSLSEALANVPEQVKEMAAARADVDFFQNYD